jgi:hypothetical protein
MSDSLKNLEDRAIAVMREAARDVLPAPKQTGPAEEFRRPVLRSVDAGLCSKLADVVRDAYVAGERRTVETVVAAWREYILNDDLDGFVEVLTDLMESAGVPRQEVDPRREED